jgi:hypothetical protein
LLQTCFERAEQLFKETCKQRSIEFWLPMVRSLAGKTIQIPNHETFSTLGLLKYCDLSANDVVPVGPDGPAFGLALQYSSDDLVDAQRLAYLAFLMAAISNAYRRIGKGACFRPTEALPLNDPAPESVAIAMKSYDDRRPRDEFFRDQALMYNVPLEPDEIYFVGTARGHDGGRFVVPEWGESWPCVRVPAFIEADGAIEVLQEYRRAFEHTHKIPLKSVFHFLSSLAALIAVSIPRQEPGGELEIRLSAREGDDETGWRRAVDFLLGFSRKGYFRFPLEHWLDKVAKTRSPWASDDADRR